MATIVKTGGGVPVSDYEAGYEAGGSGTISVN